MGLEAGLDLGRVEHVQGTLDDGIHWMESTARKGGQKRRARKHLPSTDICDPTHSSFFAADLLTLRTVAHSSESTRSGNTRHRPTSSYMTRHDTMMDRQTHIHIISILYVSLPCVVVHDDLLGWLRNVATPPHLLP